MPDGIDLGSSGLQTFLKQSGLAEGNQRVEKAAAETATARTETVKRVHALSDEQGALKPPALPDLPEMPEAHARGFTDAFGSAAGWLAVFGGLMTKKPFQASLMAATEVMKAYQSQDAANAQQAFDRWKITTDRALQLHEFQNKAYDRAVKRLDTQRENALVELQTTAAAFQDEVALQHLRAGDVDSFIKLQEARARMARSVESAALKAKEFQAKYGPALEFAKSEEGRALQQSDPEGFAKKMQALTQPSVANTLIRDDTNRLKLDLSRDQLALKKELGERALDQSDDKIAQTKWFQEQRVELMKGGLSEKVADRALREHIAEMRDETTRRGQDKTSETAQRGQDTRAATAQRGQDLTSGKATQKVDAQVAEMTTLQKDAQDLAAMLDKDPRLVGLFGRGRRLAQSVLGQTGQQKAEDRAVEEFRAKLVSLRARMSRAVLNARYFSGPAQKVASEMLPGLEAMDDPTKVKASLRQLSEILEDRISATRGASETVNETLKELSNEEVLRNLGLPPLGGR